MSRLAFDTLLADSQFGQLGNERCTVWDLQNWSSLLLHQNAHPALTEILRKIPKPANNFAFFETSQNCYKFGKHLLDRSPNPLIT